MKKNKLPLIIFLLAFVFELIFFDLAPEINYPLILFLFSLSLFLWLYRKQTLVIPKTFSLLYLLFSLGYFFSALHSPVKFLASMEIIKVITVFLLVILGVNFFRQKKIQQNIFWTLILTGAFWAFSGIIEYTGRKSIASGKILFEPFHWPSLTAGFFLLALPVTLSFFFFPMKQRYKKAVLFCSLFFIISAWILSRSYLFLLGGIVFSITIFHFQSQKKNIKELVLLCILLAFILPNLSVSFGPNSMPNAAAAFQNKIFFQNKQHLYRFARQTIQEHLWWGIGPGNFLQAYLQQQTQPWDWSDFLSNELVQTLTETGLITFLAQTALFFYLFLLAAKKFFLFKKQKGLIGLAVSFSVLAFLIINLNDFSFRIFPIQLTFFLLVSFLLTDVTHIKTKSKFSLFPIMILVLISSFFLTDGYFLRIGQKKFLQKKYSQSEKILNWLNQRPKPFLNPRVLFWLSALALEKGSSDQAISYLSQVKKINPYNDEIDYQIAASIYRQGNLDQSKTILEQKLEENRFLPPKYYLNLAKINLEQENKEEALKLFKKLIEDFSLPIRYENKQAFLAILEQAKYLSSIQAALFHLHDLTLDPQYLTLFKKWSY